MKTTLFVTLTFTGAASLLVAWNFHRDERAAVADRRLTSENLTRLSEELKNAELRLVAAEREQAALRERLGALQRKTPLGTQASARKPEATPTAAPATTVASETVAKRKALDTIAKSKQEISTLASERLRFASVYQSFFRSLALSPEQIERFLDISARQHERMTDLGQMEREGLISKDDATIAKIRADGVAAEHAAYRELLGEAGYRQFIDEQKKTTARVVMGSFAASALMAGLSINPNRLDQLVDAVASAQIPGIGWRMGDGRYATWQFDPIDWDQADARVRSLLNDAEWTIYKSQSVDRASHRLRTIAYLAKLTDDAAKKNSGVPTEARSGGK
jgi:hypothetical protein